MATIRKTFTFDSEQDAGLVAWLDAQPNASETARAALRAAFEAQQGNAPAAATLGDVVKAIEGLGAALAGWQLATVTASPGNGAGPVREDPELAAALDKLGI
ncbi:MAG: hypothetical protein M0R06_03525 [Sphaerochaeta sp.]|jgi:hypothetical protein|nr:hypothetical protein [Sphaerochaeta sp.]